MLKMLRTGVSGALLAAAMTLLVSGTATAQTCVGDCNGNGSVTSGELTRIIALILNCGGTATGCTAVPGGCTAADRNNNTIISAGEYTFVLNNVLNFSNGCPPPPTATVTNTVPVQVATATNTPVDTATFTATATASNTPIPPTPTPTPSATLAADVCGPDGTSTCCNKAVEAGEECDNGGTCAGAATNAGSPCQGNSGCPGGYCQAFGGDGCANNCTNETTVHLEFSGARCYGGAKDGLACNGVRRCVGGTLANKPCTATTDCGSGAGRGVCTSECDTAGDGSDCFGVGECTAGPSIGASCPSKLSGAYPPTSQFLCQGGTRTGAACNPQATVGPRTPTPTPVCPGGGTCTSPCGTGGVCQHRSGSVLQSIGLVGALTIGPFTGGQDLVVGKPKADGLVPVAIPAASVEFQPVKVPGLACACPAGAPAPEVHGPNNSGSGYIACGAAGLANVNINISRDHNTTPGDPNNGPGECTGGTRPGLVCAADSDCGTGGTCTNKLKGGGACIGGANLGKRCSSDQGCPGSLCVGADDASCTAEEPPPPTGSGAKACVEKKEMCTAGTMIGAPCSNDLDCGTSGVCGSTCNSGSVHPGVCNGPNRLTFSGTGPTGSAILVTNTAIGVIATPNDDGTCKRAGVCSPFTVTAGLTACQVDVECGSGKTCVSAYCSGLCTSGTVTGPCQQNADCGTGGVCEPGPNYAKACTGIPGECGVGRACIPAVAAKGFDGLPCTADDPESSRGTPQNLPTTTGTASSAIIDAMDITNTTGHLIFGNTCSGKTSCATSRQGKLFNCPALLGPNPTVSGGGLASAFNQIDAATIGDDVITVGQTAK